MKDDPLARREHWRGVYRARTPDSVSWYQPRLRTSLELIAELSPATGALAVDVGAGASSLPADLAAQGVRVVAVDLALEALRHAPPAAAPGGGAALSRPPVLRVVGDATAMPLGAGVAALWHDRAVFHFLVRAADRRRYLAEMRRVLAPGAGVVMATFGPRGPRRCSGLPVRRYDADALAAQLGPEFTPVGARIELHRTPAGRTQQFLFAAFRRTGHPRAPAGSAGA